MMYFSLVLVLIICAFALGHFIGFKYGVQYEEIEEVTEVDNTEQMKYYDYDGNELEFTNHMDVTIEFCEKEKTYFVYCTHTCKFLAMGRTRDELENNIRQLFPNTLCNVSEENLISLDF